VVVEARRSGRVVKGLSASCPEEPWPPLLPEMEFRKFWTRDEASWGPAEEALGEVEG
jgi:hypothetical protein